MTAKRIIKTLALPVALCTGFLCFSSCTAERQPSAQPVKTEPRYASDAVTHPGLYTYENKNLILTMDKETTAVTVTQKATGKVWASNPPKEEWLALTNAQRQNLGSQITLSITDAKGNNTTLDNYNDSVAKGQFTIRELSDGIRVDYVIGNADLVPIVMEKGAFERYLGQMDETERSYVLRYYTLNTYEKAVNAAGGDAILQKYPALREKDLYIGSAAAASVKTKIAAAFRSAGLTAGDLDATYKAIGYTPKEDLSPRFTLSLEYRLDNESFMVRIPKESLDFDEANYKLRGISFLKQFGAQKTGSEGYILVPDGSGALIRFSKPVADVYSQPVYGMDYAYMQQPFTGDHEEAALPVYGIKAGDGAMFAVIESNESHASITAGSDGEGGSFFAFPNFDVAAHEHMAMSGRSRNGMEVFSEALPQEDYAVRYFFLDGDQANYSGMARLYREYLFAGRKPLQAGETTPLFLQMYGAVPVAASVFGVGVTQTRVLTSYADVGDMVSELNQSGVGRVYVQYRGWLNGGMKNTVPTKIDLLGKLGGKNGFQKLQAQFANSADRLYPEVDFAYVWKDTAFDGFSLSRDAARYLDNTLAKRFDFDPATLGEDNASLRYIVIPDKYVPFAEKFISAYSSFTNHTLFLASFGEALNSNFYRGKDEISRDQSEGYLRQTLDLMQKRGYQTMASYGNAYMLPYVSTLSDVPLASSNYNMESESVPFLAMVLRGYVEYAGEPMNLSGNPGLLALQSMESGADLQYVVNRASVEMTKGTDYSYLFSSEFSDEKGSIVQKMQEWNKVLGSVAGVAIESHEILANGLRMTRYANGIDCLVNYTDSDLQYAGVTVKAQGYSIGRNLGKGE